MSPYAAFFLFLAIGLADSSLTYDDYLETTTTTEATTPEAPTLTTKATTPEAPSPTTKATTPEAPSPTTEATTPEAPSPTTEATTPEAPSPTTEATTPEAPSPTTEATTPEAPSPTTEATTPEAPSPTTEATTPEAPSPTTEATTTEAPSPTTTTVAPTNTTANSTTPPAPTTTTPAPTLPTPSIHQYQVKSSQDNTTCLLVKFGFRLGFHGVKYEEINFEFTNETNVSGICGEDYSELWIQAETLTLKLTFFNDSKKFSLHALNATGKMSSGVPFMEHNDNMTLWQASLGSSYMCNKEQNHTITNKLTMFTFELQVQPFGIKKDSFSTAEDCMPDGESFIVPIAVGVALLVLILIVLVAYFIGRKRNMASAEECFLDSDLSFLVPIAVGVALSFLIILVLISYLIGRRKSRTGYQSV